jgi:ABC-2 type transport system permease protein
LWKKELAAYFLSPIAYVLTVFFLVFMGVSFQFLVGMLTGGVQVESTHAMNRLFGESIFFWIGLLMVIPLLTMRLFAEERKSGTFESLMTAPIGDTAVVMAKYGGALAFYAVMWTPTLAYAFILEAFSPSSMPPDWGPLISSYLGAFAVGAFFLSIGVLTSALSRNQIVAGISCFVLVFLLFLVGFVPYVSRNETLQAVTRLLSSIDHMMDFSRGAVDSRALLYYLTGTAVTLFATVRVVEARRWN